MDPSDYEKLGQFYLGREYDLEKKSSAAGNLVLYDSKDLVTHAIVVGKRITLNRWVEVTSTTPAKIMGMFPKKGTIAVGSDADIVIWDPRSTSTISAKTHHMRVDYNPYEGRKVKGKAAVALSRGEVIVQKDKFVGKKGRGRFIKRGSPILQT